MSWSTQPPSPPYDTALLEVNLAALMVKAPELAARLMLPVDNSHVLFDEEGHPHYRLHSDLRPLAIDPELVDPEEEGDGEKGVVVWGVGCGELLAHALERHPDCPVVAWDRDPWLLRLALMGRDYADPIREGRLRLALGADLVGLARPPFSGVLLVHPFLGALYRRELDLFCEGIGEKRGLLCTGRLMVEDVAEALEGEGYDLFTLDHDKLSIEEMDYIFQQFRPGAVFAVNYAEGLSEQCAKHAVKVVVWEIDPSTNPLGHCETAWNAYIFTYRSAQVEAYRGAGFRHVRHLPLAANPRRRKPAAPMDAEELADYLADVAFVGASMAEQANTLRHHFLHYYQNSFGRGQEVRKRAEQLFQQLVREQGRVFDRFVVPELLSHLAPELAGPQGIPPPFIEDPAMLVGESAACQRRLMAVGLLGRFGVHVWGDAGWAEVERFGARYRGPAGHWQQLNKIYSTAKINVDINRVYQLDIVTMRVFDVMACGGFVLAEHSEDLEQLFDVGGELDSFRSPDELLDKVSFYLARPELRQEIARRGRDRVLGDHTIAQRVKAMLGHAGL